MIPEIGGGNMHAASITIGEKAAEMVAGDHSVKLAQFVGVEPANMPRLRHT